MRKTYKMTFAGILIALGTVTGNLISIPIGVSKVFPVQHFINVVSAVFLGPWYAMGNAFMISLLRNLFGTGSLLAFPGSMVGAGLAGFLYWGFKRLPFAVIGEVVGTGILGAIISAPLAKWLYGTEAAAFYFVTPFLLSTVTGSIIAWVVLSILKRRGITGHLIGKEDVNNEKSTNHSRI